MKQGGWGATLAEFLASPANLTGLGLASLALAARLAGWIDSLWLLIVAGSYGLGWQIGRLAFSREATPLINPLAQNEAERSDIQDSLNRILSAVSQNQDGRFDYILRRTVVELCAQIKTLMARMETSSTFISPDEAHSVKQIVLDYLPHLIESFIAIPGDFAANKALAEGKTAQELLKEQLTILQRKTVQMADDLAARDAASFLHHARFLQEKFGQESRLIDRPSSKPEL